ncbi:MAG: AAA family ATPase, partial [Limnobacter sp.]|nr:AAA family ATPase [Limnobacter sp.]
PCGTCQACLEITQGRFVDLLEVDAATNTKVDEMRQLLENAMYAPTAGRYKVYVIDEVHMLSASSFNAMLKTLEEPPGHVLFILATTDPQKFRPRCCRVACNLLYASLHPIKLRYTSATFLNKNPLPAKHRPCACWPKPRAAACAMRFHSPTRPLPTARVVFLRNRCAACWAL